MHLDIASQATPASPALNTVQTQRRWLAVGGALALLSACSSAPKRGSSAGSSADSGRPAAPSTALALPPDGREAVLARAMLVVNTPYTYGGNTPEGGFDCSGLVLYVVSGVTEQRLPRTTAQWAQASAPINARDLQRGDFVFFNTSGGRFSHMGIFVGQNQFVHAPSTGGTVRHASMANPYFAKRFTEARSIFAA